MSNPKSPTLARLDVPEDLDASVGDTDPTVLRDKYVDTDLSAQSTYSIYNKRIAYHAQMLSGYNEYENLVDFNFAEKHLYGRTTRNFVPIVPSNVSAKLVSIPNTENNQDFKALNFVAENFNEMSRQFRKATVMRKISENDKYLSTLKVHKAYESPHSLYRKHSKNYREAVSSLFAAEGAQITNFDEFLGRLLPYLARAAPTHPFTFPAFVKSNYCPVTISGLVIEIADVGHSHDIDKILKFKNSRNWDYYLNACQNYGFMVDRFYPWRLVADIAATPMLSKAAAYGIGSTDSILNIGYIPAHRRYYNTFASRMLAFYNQAKREYSSTTYCGNRLVVEKIAPHDYTLESFAQTYPPLLMFRLYCTIRFHEEESPFSEHEKSRLVENCLEVAAKAPYEALDIFERILNKTFDYMGSLEYIRDRFERIDHGK